MTLYSAIGREKRMWYFSKESINPFLICFVGIGGSGGFLSGHDTVFTVYWEGDRKII